MIPESPIRLSRPVRHRHRQCPEVPMNQTVFGVARILVVVLFVVSGAGKLMNPAAVVNAVSGKGLPYPQILAYLTIAAELGLGLLIALGFYARAAALLLAVFTAATIVVFHNFWSMSGDAFRTNQIQALKNLSIIGALLMIAAAGPGRLALNQR
jgi:putative oxidoreductase